ncbi:MAG: Monoterpene epsilon-lactone hydrolase [Chlamydiae bacterium]|nr:Monoterpene epsilon-lactone hydrolase [Chlamydiota bacterium]
MSSKQVVSPFYHVPSTVSEEAQIFLRTAIPVGGPVDSIDTWQAIRKGFAEFSKTDHDKALIAHVEKVDQITLKNVPVTVVTPKDYDSEGGNIMIYIHGGAYTLGSADHLFQVFAPVAHQASLKTYAINYRLAPKFPFPSGLNDCVKVYKKLLKTHEASKIFFFGDSAGGSLALSTLLKARDEESLPMPAAIGLFSPMAEAEKKGDTFYSLEGRSPVLNYEDSLKPSLDVYVPKEIELCHPYDSPVNGNFKGFPPTKIVSGTRDYFLSSCTRLRLKMRRDGVKTDLDIYEGMGHGFQQNFKWAEAQESREEMAKFFKEVIADA